MTRNTTGGAFQLKQVWARPDAAEKDVTVTITVKNLSSAALSGVLLSRTADLDVGTSPTDQGAETGHSVWQWDDDDALDSPPGGLMLTALTFSTSYGAEVVSRASWAGTTNPARDNCSGVAEGTPTGEGDYAIRMNYALGNLSAGQSKTVKFVYGRM